MYKHARADLLLNLPIWAGAALFCYGFFYRDHNRKVEERTSRSSSDVEYVADWDQKKQ
jgi:hypothetical protein